MRIGYPLLFAFIKWGRSHENRAHALQELKDACPEIEV